MRVVELAKEIAIANSFDNDEVAAACLAGMLHDVARDLTPEKLLELAPAQNDVERMHPLSVHGRAGRKIAERWGIEDGRVLEAISGHVFGVSPENRVGMAVYIADVTEPGRQVNHDIRELAMTSLFRAYQRAVDSKVRYLRSKGKSVHPETLRVYEAICNLT
ncbi:MAG: bis(5'-nucleosyl)-tetraphosphatase (symmetrical) YqeK [Trueperaceae bacterium]|nr:MAG: bis(5'-nucleosyl)-tetraphosphatase (symmetrical) YqeK [Trueperaceae bacterium]